MGGGPIKGGRVIGESDELGYIPKTRPVTPRRGGGDALSRAWASTRTRSCRARRTGRCRWRISACSRSRSCSSRTKGNAHASRRPPRRRHAPSGEEAARSARVASRPHGFSCRRGTRAQPYTGTIEFLLAPAAFDHFCLHAAEARFEQVGGRSRRFVDSRNGAAFEVFLTGHHPGRNGPTPIPFPDPQEASETRETYRVLTLPWLIQLKLAANTHGDAADAVYLIQGLELDEAMIEQLHPSAHERYRYCLAMKRRDDKWEAAGSR